MSHELKGREIFAVGTWNGKKITQEDLQDIADNFAKLFDVHKVPLKFGHDSAKEVPDGQPAIGWVSNVYVQGSKLLADFMDVPRTVYEAIKKKLYRNVSIELLFNTKADGTSFNHVLDAVALLGADHPAVNTLADLDALLAKRSEFNGGQRIAFTTTAGKLKFTQETEMTAEEIKKAVDSAVNAAMAPLTEANAKLTKDLDAANQTIAKFKKDTADADEKAKMEKVTLARKAITDHLDAAVRCKTLIPAHREIYEKQIGLHDDERVVNIDLEQVKAMYKAEEPKFDRQGLTGDDNDTGDDPENELLAAVYKYQAEKGENNFQVAFNRVTAANPELHKAYLNANGEV